jgi:plastocyanin domain-containing protein
MMEGSKIMSMGAHVNMHMKSNHHVDTTKEVRFDLLVGTCIVSCHGIPLIGNVISWF